MDCLHPGSVNMRKVDFNVRNDYEMEKNYKELQAGFTKKGIDRAFNVRQLTKGKLQDNVEFLQWFKGYFDDVTGPAFVTDYNAIERRQLCKSGDWKRFSLAGTAATIPAVRRAAHAPAPARKAATAKVDPAARVEDKIAAHGAGARAKELAGEVEQLKAAVENAERERDFYFSKLRDIEILCQAPELAISHPILKLVERILYAADEDEAKEAMAVAQSEYSLTLGPEEAQAGAGETVDEDEDAVDIVAPMNASPLPTAAAVGAH
jgi:microtubule-associated protein, RP/EB family